jgi:hypothetical protein
VQGGAEDNPIAEPPRFTLPFPAFGDERRAKQSVGAGRRPAEGAMRVAQALMTSSPFGAEEKTAQFGAATFFVLSSIPELFSMPKTHCPELNPDFDGIT